MPAPITIREAEIADVPAIVEMMAGLAEEEGGESQLDASALKEAIEVGAPELLILIAQQQEEVTGCLLAYPGYDVLSASHGLHLSDIYVRPACRGHGAGRALIREAASVALNRDMVWMSWTVLRGNRGAQAFYRAIGADDVDVRFMAIGISAMRQLCQR